MGHTCNDQNVIQKFILTNDYEMKESLKCNDLLFTIYSLNY